MSDRGFATQLGQKKSGDNPVVVKTTHFSHACLRKHRAITASCVVRITVRGSGKSVSLADDIFRWCQEQGMTC